MQKITVVLLSLFILLGITGAVNAQTTVTIPAQMDNTLYEDATGMLSNGAASTFFVGRTGQNENSIRRGLLAFDIAGNVPTTATIESVTLTLYMSKTIAGASDIMLHKVTAAWGEGASDASGPEGSGTDAAATDATWLHRMYDTDMWTNPGGDYMASMSASASVDTVGSYSWGPTAQMVADVQSWLEMPMDNYGWILLGDESMASTSKRFDSRENSTEANRPMLAVTYTDTPQMAMIDRFSADAGNLFVRDETNGFPGPNEPIDFDMEPFITHGLGPNGECISYYNFDVQPTTPAPIWLLFREGEDAPVEEQHNIINVIPGDEGYNDFWNVRKVTVPADYVANTATSYADIMDAGYPVEETTILINCPVVPDGSTAKWRYAGESPELTTGWYKGLSIYYFNFLEKELMVDESDMVPLSPIYVAFNINPDQPMGGPPSGFVVDETGRAHNVTATLPLDDNYSPLWSVNVYDNADWDMVGDLTSAQAANILATGVATVNCPVVKVDEPTATDGEDSSVPYAYSLSQNYPNPFNPSTQIQFSVAQSERVVLRLYNIRGELVSELVNKNFQPGNYSIRWNAENVSSGVYFYTIEAGSYRMTKKMTLLK